MGNWVPESQLREVAANLGQGGRAWPAEGGEDLECLRQVGAGTIDLARRRGDAPAHRLRFADS